MYVKKDIRNTLSIMEQIDNRTIESTLDKNDSEKGSANERSRLKVVARLAGVALLGAGIVLPEALGYTDTYVSVSGRHTKITPKGEAAIERVIDTGSDVFSWTKGTVRSVGDAVTNAAGGLYAVVDEDSEPTESTDNGLSKIIEFFEDTETNPEDTIDVVGSFLGGESIEYDNLGNGAVDATEPAHGGQGD